MSRITVFIITFLMISVCFFGIFSGSTKSATLTKIVVDSNPVTETTLEVPDQGGNYNLGYISIRKGVPVYEASFNLSFSPNQNGEYLENLQIDIGNDGDYQYRFVGTGNGGIGQQTVFSTGSSTSGYSFDAGGSQDLINIKLHKNAQVTSAEMQVSGEPYEWGVRSDIESSTTRNRVCTADVDNDGNIDVIASGANDVVWYNNTNGDCSNWVKNEVITNQQSDAALCVFDVDSDGDMDIVAVDRAGYYGPGKLVYYRNMDGKGTLWESTVVNTSINSCYNVAVADMDNDGDGDIVATSYYYATSNFRSGVFWYNNTDGNGTEWENKTIINDMIYTRELIVMDVDGDGDNDTITTNANWADGKIKIYWFENIGGNATKWAKHTIVSRTLTYQNTMITSLEKYDIDNDGDHDIIAMYGTDLWWYPMPSDPKTTWSGHQIGTFYSSTQGAFFTDCALGNLGTPLDPPDGEIDIVTVTDRSELLWWKNVSTPGNWEKHYITHSMVPAYNVEIVDLNGIGYPEVVTNIRAVYPYWDVGWYKLNSSFPTQVELDIGGDSNIDWTYPTGNLDSTITVKNLANNLNTLIGTAPVGSTDSYGNEFVNLGLKTTTSTPGSINFQQLNIKYDLTVKVVGRIDWTLAEELNSLASSPGEGNHSIPIKVNCTNGGKIKLSNLFIMYNEYPQETSIDGYSIDEDTRNDFLIDLSKHFSDDYLTPRDLYYDVVSYTNKQFVTVYINEIQSYYLGVDTETGPDNDNWNGNTTVIVNATDSVGLITYSKPFKIYINPVNDEPTVGSRKLPDLTISEGGSSHLVDLDEGGYFDDIDSTELYFQYVIDPLGEHNDEQLSAGIDPATNELIVEASGDWYTSSGKSVRLRVYCDDDTDEIPLSLAYQDIFITVNNIPDDPPVWQKLPTVELDEDEDRYFAFNPISDQLIEDIDTDLDDLIFSIYSISDDGVTVEIDSQKNVYITPEENFFGKVNVDLKASDSINSAVAGFEVIVYNINDKPEVELLSPINNAVLLNDTVILKWKGS
ncbi:MAG: VCBS repeat-containing protein, partial [Thermoplasmata archaeon]